jgi:hypothetical protein
MNNSNIAKNIKSLSSKYGFKETDPRVQHFVDRFHRSRVGMRMLIGHYIALYKPLAQEPDQIGIVNVKTDPSEGT